MHRWISIGLCIAFALAAPGSATSAAAAGGAPASGVPIELDVILPLTGSGAFLGTQEQRAIGILEKVINQEGGIRGRPVKFALSDDQTSPALAVQLASGLIAKKVPVILGSAVSAMCFAMQPLVEKSGPVEYCFSPAGRGAPGSYIFSASVGTYANAYMLVRYFRELGWTKLGMILATDATGQDFEREVDRVLALPENKTVSFVAREHFNPSDLGVEAQLSRIKSANPQGLITFTTGTALGTVLRSFQESGMDIPISAAAGNMVYPQMAQYKDILPKRVFFAATRGVAPDPTLRPGPIHDAQDRYFNALRAAGVRSDYGSTLVWDPVMIVVDGLRKLGPDTSAEKLRDWILNLHGWAGIDGLYDFRDGSQKGLSLNAMTIYRWDAPTSSFVVAARPERSPK